MRYGTGEYYTSVSMRSVVLDAMFWRLHDGTTHEAYCEIGTGTGSFSYFCINHFCLRARIVRLYAKCGRKK